MAEQDMIDLLQQRYTRIRRGTTADRYVRVEHPRHVPMDSWQRVDRIADYVVFDTYGDTEIIGFEIKVSRSDWLKELSDIEKSDIWRKHVNRWYLVVSDPGIVRDDLPEGWGLMVIGSNGQLRVKTQSAYNAHPQQMNTSTQGQFYRAIAKTAQKEIVRARI